MIDRIILNLILLTTLFGSILASEEYRLPSSIVPEHYDIEILSHLNDHENFTFYGTVLISFNTQQDTENIILHSKELKIIEDSIKVKNINDEGVYDVIDVKYGKDTDFLIITLNNLLKQGMKYEVKISFQGQLTDNLIGYYRSSYKNSSNEKEWLAVTQFEPNYARRAFPCFDEPALKATFKIKLGRYKQFTSISNMPIINSVPIVDKPDWFWDIFEKSVPMSTYLVAYMVSNFDYTESSKNDSNILFRIWARKDAISQTHYASEIGPKVLSYYEELFNVPYPLPKQDMIAVPDFHSGAMENWGLITYRETALLYQPNISSTSSKYRVASVIAHELAHQWAGNLVTMKWWTDLWLNEGFATYIATLGVNHVHPEWNILQEEAVDNFVDVFKLDALNNSHPVSVPIGHPNEINQIFDVISYKKGSAIIRMMNSFLGEDAFRKGITNYLLKYKYKNAEQDDLWESLTQSAHESGILSKDITVKKIMDSWTKQTGYPLIFVNRNYLTNSAEISQVRYRSIPSLFKSTQTWWVPITYTSRGGNQLKTNKDIEWLRENPSMEIINITNSNNWVLFNNDMSGLYRVNYDDQNWQLLINGLNAPNFDGISTLNRIQLIIDSMDLAWTGQLNYDVALRLTQYVAKEEEYIPWRGALNSLGRINGILKRTKDYGIFKKYMRKLISPQFNKIGGLNSKVVSTPDRLDAVKHQILISSWACRVDVPNCKKHALQLFYKWMKEPNPDTNNKIPSDLRSEVYCVGINKGGEAEWQFLWQRYLNTNVASEKDIIRRSLGCTTEIWLLIRYLEWSITEKSGIRLQDSSGVFDKIGASDVGYYVAKKFLYERISDIRKFHQETPSTLGRYVKTIAYQMASEKEFLEFKKWLEEKKDLLKESSIAVKQAVETVEIKLEWLKKHHSNVIDVLTNITK